MLIGLGETIIDWVHGKCTLIGTQYSGAGLATSLKAVTLEASDGKQYTRDGSYLHQESDRLVTRPPAS
jgi:hypothetical protein